MEMEYEICYLIGETKETNLEEIRKNVEKIIIKNKGALIDGEFVKKRRLAYKIKKEARGTFVAKRFTLPSKNERDEKYPEKDFISEMTKDFNFNQDILRFIFVKADELPSLEELKEQVKEASEERRGNQRNEKEFRKETQVRKKIVTPAKKKMKKKASVEIKVKKEKIEKKIKVEKKIKKELPIKNGAKKKKELKNDISEDNIDEKLDEILNI